MAMEMQMRSEKDITGIIKRVNMVFKDKSYTSRLRTKNANWLGVDSEDVTKGLIFFRYSRIL